MPGFSNPDAYEQWMGRWSRRLAPAFVRFANPPSGGKILDVGCGTGALSTALLETLVNGSVVGIDPSRAYIAHCRRYSPDQRLHFQSGDATGIPFADESFDATLSFLVLQEIPDARKAVREMRRVTRPGGCVASSQWDFEDGLPMLACFWEAAIEIVADEPTRREATRVMAVDYPDEDALGRLWEQSNLVDVEVRSLQLDMTFESFEDYWTPFLSGVTASASFAGRLSQEQKSALEDRLRHELTPDSSDGSFTLPARAWAVRGAVA